MWTVSVEDVNGLSSGHLDVLHCIALPGLQSLPFPGSDQHHARLTSMSVNLELEVLLDFKILLINQEHIFQARKFSKIHLVRVEIKVAVTLG